MLAGVVGSGGDGGTGWGADSDQVGGGWAAPVAVAKKEQPGMISALSRKGRSRCRRGVVHLKIESLEVAQVRAEAGAPDHRIECYLITGAPLDAGGSKATEHRGGREEPRGARLAHGWRGNDITQCRNPTGILRIVGVLDVAGGQLK